MYHSEINVSHLVFAMSYWDRYKIALTVTDSCCVPLMKECRSSILRKNDKILKRIFESKRKAGTGNSSIIMSK
jgi:hypothetical protein